MPNELFGTPSGFRAYDEDQRQLADLAGTTMLRAGQAEHQKSLSALNQAQARNLDAQSAAEGKRAAMYGEAFGGAPATAEAPTLDDLTEQLRRIAWLEGKSGNLKGMEDATKVASQVVQQQAAADASKASEELRRTRATQEKLSYVEQRLAGIPVGDAKAYGAVLMELQQSPLLKGLDISDFPTTYDPVWVSRFVANSKTANNKLELQLKQADLARKQNDSKVRNAQRERDVAVHEANSKAYRDQVDAKVKAGEAVARDKNDKPIGISSPEEVDAVKKELKELGYHVGNKDALAVQARDMADEAKYMAQKRRISVPEARAQVMKDAIARGDLKIDNGLFSNDTTYKPTQGSFGKPIPVKKGMYLEDLQPNQYYRMEDGSIKMFDPEELKRSAAAPALRPPANNPLADDEE
jgi:hypothetical protein